MKIRVTRSHVFNHRISRIGDVIDVPDTDGTYLVENKFAERLDDQKVIAEQIGLENPAFGMNDVQIKAGPKKTRKKHA